MTRKQFIISSIIIILFASFLRLFKLGQIPAGLYWDEIAMLVDAKSISQSGKDMHGNSWAQFIFPSYGDYKLPVYIWLAAVSVKFFGVSDFALRLPSALAGIGTIVVGGYIARELTKHLTKDTIIHQFTQLTTMMIISFSPWSLLFSRTGFEGHIAQFLVALSLLVVLKSKRRFWLFPAVFFGVLATYTYFSVRFVWPPAFIGISFLAYNKKNILRGVISTIVGLVLYALLLLPMSQSNLYQASNQFRYSTSSVLNQFDYPVMSNVYRELAGNSPLERIFFHRHLLLLREFGLNVGDHLSPEYLFVSGDANLRHGTGEHGLFLLSTLPFLLAGLLICLVRDKRVFAALLIWWFVALVPASVPETTPHALRSLNALVPIAVFIGIGAAFCFKKLPHSGRYLIIGLFSLEATLFVCHYFTQYKLDSGSDWQAGYAHIAKRIQQLKAENEISAVYVYPFDTRFYLWLMAYGPYTATDFHSWESEDYHFKQIDTIYLPTTWKMVSVDNQKVLVVGKNLVSDAPIAEEGFIYQEELELETTPKTYQFIIMNKGVLQ
jgi:4-amino-4-deoxy-L-arabinose transferase-like glycosyltransferase